MKKIIVTGATGLIGNNIVTKLISREDNVIIFSRSPEHAEKKIRGAYDYVKWNYDMKGDWEESVKEADAVIHLAGENVMGGRWTDEHKKKVLESRKKGTRNLVDAICETNSSCKVFVGASAIGYYNNDKNLEVDENSPSGSSFLAEVTKVWEEETARVEKCNVRRVSIRIGIVLSKDGGALAKMITPFKFFVGGPIGSGKQWFPWIHIDDIANLFIYAVDNEIEGVFNGVTPNPVKMDAFSKCLGKVLRRPALFRVPEFVLKIVLGEATETVTQGSKVLPRRTNNIGYKFIYEDIEEALKNLLKRQ